MPLTIKTDNRVLRSLIAHSDDMAEQALDEMAHQVVGQMRGSMDKTRKLPSGHAAKGSPPAVQTGRLKDSLSVHSNSDEARITGAYYGSFLDKQDHPFVDDNLPSDDDIRDALRDAINQQARRA